MGMVPPRLLFRPRNNQLKEDHPASYQETNAGMDEPAHKLPVSEYTAESYDPELLMRWPPQGGSDVIPYEFRVDYRLIGDDCR